VTIAQRSDRFTFVLQTAHSQTPSTVATNHDAR
jgi:hypothetical protein